MQRTAWFSAQLIEATGESFESGFCPPVVWGLAHAPALVIVNKSRGPVAEETIWQQLRGYLTPFAIWDNFLDAPRSVLLSPRVTVSNQRSQ